jgi:hypothetical protein
LAMSFLYSVDTASNLFPSIHCLVSWFCFIGIRGNQKIPLWYRAFSFVAAILVFISYEAACSYRCGGGCIACRNLFPNRET